MAKTFKFSVKTTMYLTPTSRFELLAQAGVLIGEWHNQPRVA